MRIFFALMLLAAPAHGQDWKPITEELLKREKPGYGGLCGVALDRADGRVYVNVSDRGVFRTADGGVTWERFGAALKGRTETPGCLLFDPTGNSKRLLMATVYGGPIAATTSDSGAWRIFDKASAHVDWCVADWADPELKFLLAFKHESGGQLLRSRDGGKSFDELGKGHGPAWVFDAKTAVVALPKSKDRPKGAIVRTTDGGGSFQPVSEFAPQWLPRWHAGALYWLADGQLIKTTDKGETWKKVGDLKDGRLGPVSGKNEKHLFVLTGKGIVESVDGGATWTAPHAIPKELKGVSPLTWLDYDPKADSLYVMKMTSELYVWNRAGRK